MKNWQLKFGLVWLKCMRFFFGKSFMCSHVFIRGIYLHKGKRYELKCAICGNFHEDSKQFPVVGQTSSLK